MRGAAGWRGRTLVSAARSVCILPALWRRSSARRAISAVMRASLARYASSTAPAVSAGPAAASLDGVPSSATRAASAAAAAATPRRRRTAGAAGGAEASGSGGGSRVSSAARWPSAAARRTPASTSRSAAAAAGDCRGRGDAASVHSDPGPPPAAAVCPRPGQLHVHTHAHTYAHTHIHTHGAHHAVAVGQVGQPLQARTQLGQHGDVGPMAGGSQRRACLCEGVCGAVRGRTVSAGGPGRRGGTSPLRETGRRV
jgi:hypothetical protein